MPNPSHAPATEVAGAVLRSWPVDPWLWAALALTALVYLRGWRALRLRDPGRWPAGQAIAFLGGLLALFVALGSPLEPFTALLLQAHMAQHVLLLMVAPPLLWLGAPVFPLVRGLPAPVRSFLAPVFGSPRLHALFRRLTHPVGALIVLVVATWAWHAPALYELALRSDGWHYVQHACFLAAGLIFWHPVVRPYPARPAWSQWLLVPYLIAADVQNTALSALLTFSDTPLYPHYAAVPRLGGASALEDQAAAGVLMWVPGSLAYLVPLFVIGVGLLYPPAKRAARRVSLPVLGGAPRQERFNFLKLPFLGRFLRWRHARLAMQVPLLLLAAAVIADGLLGPDVAPLSLAGVLPWIHWRGLVVLGLLIAGNVFCMGCPFLLPRTLARRLLPAGRSWPRWLRNKWPSVVLLALFLWAYEALALWDRPWLTAWLALGYFAAALAIDGLYRHAPFCKYVCPIGQFNFVQSLVSPLEVTVRDPAVCDACATKDCIRGSETSPGCELALYLPRKRGNMDCTFCLDCAHACPHDNVAVAGRVPGAELCHDPQRSGVGKFSRRGDLAALVALLVFGAFANAAGMIGPVVEWQERLEAATGLKPWAVVTLFYAVALIGLPALAVGGCAWLSGAPARRFVWCLVPLGAAMWLSHYGFHFFTSYDAVVPATQRAAFDLGFLSSAPEWVCSCCVAVPGWLVRLEILWLDLGLLASLYVAWRISEHRWRVVAPWAVVILLLFALGVWILLEPMQMRGTMAMAG
jgi:cytochrome c oxidase assembly factor CtaG/ferredoxin